MKKLILPIIFAFIMVLFFVPSHEPAFAFLGLGESSSEFDCQKFWENLSEGDQLAIVGTQQLGSKWQLASDKNVLQKKNSDYCELKGQQFDTDSEGELRNGFELSISYFQNQEEASSKLGFLKTSESVKVDDKNILSDTYSMRTLNVRNEEGGWTTLLPGNYGRTVGRVGNCVVSLTQTWYALANQWNTGGEYDKQAGLMDIIMVGTKAGWQKLAETEKLQQFCGGKGESDQKPKASQPQQTQSNQAGQPTKSVEQKSETGKKVGKESSQLNLFNINPMEIWRNIQGLLSIPEGFSSLVQAGEFLTGSTELKIQVPEPAIATDSEGKPWDFLPGYIPHESIEPGKLMRVTEPTRLSDKDSQTFLELRPGQSNQAVLKIPGKDENNLFFLRDGEVEVVKKISGVSDSIYDGIKTPNATVISVQTHYWVSYNKEKNQTAVAVYEGKVEVKTNDGKTTILAPNDNKPGVVVVSQKLSIRKLAIIGAVLIIVIAGAAIIFKRIKSKPRKR